MANISDFISKLKTISGVRKYVFSKEGGEIIAHNLKNPYYFNSWMEEVLRQGDGINTIFGNPGFKGISLAINNENSLFLFPVKHYNLLVIKDAEVVNDQLFQEITDFIQDTLEKNN